GPYRNVRSCSGPSPPLSQAGQSSGWLTRMNSSVPCWPSAARFDVAAVRTTMPSCAVSVQPAWSFGSPSTSTRHIRPAPARGADPWLVTEDGDLDPRRLSRLHEPGALRDLDLAVVDREPDEVAHATTSSGRWISCGPTCASWTSAGGTMPASDDAPRQGP